MIIWKLVKSILIIVVILVAARYVIPLVLEQLVTMNMRDVLVIASVVIAMGIAWITESLGLSLAIGAFLAGLALSDTDFTHQIISDINPFRDVLLVGVFRVFRHDSQSGFSAGKHRLHSPDFSDYYFD